MPGSAFTETPQIVCKEVVRDEEVTRVSDNRFFPVAGVREGTPIVEVPGVNEVRMLDVTGRVVTSYGDIIYEPRGTPESSGATLRPANSPASRTSSPSLSIRSTTSSGFVLRDPPSGLYEVEVVAQPFPANSFDQLRSQPFALVFVGSREEARFGGMSPVGAIPFY